MGDPTALEILIRSYYSVLCRFAEKMLPDASLAKDVVQESFIKLWKSDKTFDSTQALKVYLYTITRNGCLDLIRSRNRLDNRHQQATADVEEAQEPVITEIIRAESVALIFQVIKDMPSKMREILFLSYRDGMTVSEIAAARLISVNTAKTHVRAVYRKLGVSNRYAAVREARRLGFL